MTKVEETPIKRKHRWITLDFFQKQGHTDQIILLKVHKMKWSGGVLYMVYGLIWLPVSVTIITKLSTVPITENLPLYQAFKDLFFYKQHTMWMYISQVSGPQIISLWRVWKGKTSCFSEESFHWSADIRHTQMNTALALCAIIIIIIILEANSNVWVRVFSVLFFCMWSWTLISSYLCDILYVFVLCISNTLYMTFFSYYLV